ncbi:MAG TPA: carbohydrate-binding protein, partial [Polyangiaceae bacterium]|nr:carbohydrate-binding protein [Polyangiaceae bacterium]
TVSLSAGTHELRMQLVTGNFNLNYLDVTQQQASAIPLPGRIQAESYNSGGEGVGYHDTTAGNSGGQFRQDNVDIETTSDTGGGYDVGWTDTGEWLEYTVNVASAGSYQLTARVASGTAGTKTVGVTLDGSSLGQASFTDASGWQSWRDLVIGTVSLSAGAHELRIQMVTGGFNLNYLDVTQQQTTAIPLPGRIQAESYNPGGEGVGYHDTTAGNTGGQFRQDNVDIETTSDVGGGYDVGWTDTGEWLEYTVNVAKTSTYTLTARVASGAAGTKTLGVTLDGASLGSASFTDASGWQSWQNLQLSRVQLTAGTHELRILEQTGGFNLNYVDVADAGDSDAYGACFDTPKTSRVLVLVYDEYHASIHRDEATHNHAVVDPVAASHQLVDTFRQTSHGLVNYQITDVRFFNSEPPQGVAMPGNTADYNAIFQQNDICNLVQTQNLSEVWVWGDGSAGLDELAYKVPNDAVPNNAQAESDWFYTNRKKNIPDCGKTIWVMGFNYQVDLGYAVHSYNHRVESIVSLLVGQGHWLQNVDPNNPWQTFSRYDQISPGHAGVGTTHFPPNGTADYDYANPTLVASTADDFLNDYPNLTGATTQVNCNTWGFNQLGYEDWYESHLPHVTGTSYLNTCNSWWTYIADYDRRNTGCSGTSCLQATGALCGLNSECASNNCACGQCAAAGSTPSCVLAAFDTCSSASQCGSGICGCPGESTPTECLPNSSYSQTCMQPNGSACWGDADCTSGICGCAGGSALMCLAPGQSRTCSNIPNWSPCTQDADCTSAVCGCDGGPLPKVCLPSTAYPRNCTN